MKRSTKDISPIPTSHKAGMKRVLLAANESDCPITQIAITDLKAGEVAETHSHEDMQEGFYVLSGELDIVWIRGTGTFIHSLYTNKHNIFPQELLSKCSLS